MNQKRYIFQDVNYKSPTYSEIKDDLKLSNCSYNCPPPKPEDEFIGTLYANVLNNLEVEYIPGGVKTKQLSVESSDDNYIFGCTFDYDILPNYLILDGAFTDGNYKTVNLGNVKTPISNLEQMCYGSNIIEFIFGNKVLKSRGGDDKLTFNEAFYGCSSLISVDLNNVSVQNDEEVSFSNAFRECASLQNLDLSNFNINSLSYAFSGCTNLESVEFTDSLNPNLTNITGAFNNCSNLESINLSGFTSDTKLGFQNTFNNCSNLTDLVLFETKVNRLTSAFKNCSSLQTLDVSCIDVSEISYSSLYWSAQVTDIFSGMTNLKTLNMSNMDFSSLADYYDSSENSDDYLGWFTGDNSLETIILQNSNQDTIDIVRHELSMAGLNDVTIITSDENNKLITSDDYYLTTNNDEYLTTF